MHAQVVAKKNSTDMFESACFVEGKFQGVHVSRELHTAIQHFMNPMLSSKERISGDEVVLTINISSAAEREAASGPAKTQG